MFKILIVDDSIMLRKSLKKVLESLGHSVIAEAGSGYDGIEEYKKHKPDIVTMDITMPGVQGIMDGVEALKKIKEIDQDANIIMITPHGEEELVMDAIANGAKGYILKPITPEKINSIFNKIIK